MITTTQTRTNELILKKGRDEYLGFTRASNFRSWINGQLSKYAKDDSREGLQAEFVLKSVQKAYNHFHKETELEVSVESWHKKSSFDIIQGVDKITIIKYQKKDKFSEPEQVTTECLREEIEALIKAIKNHCSNNREAKTVDLAFDYCLNLGIKITPDGNKLFGKDNNFWTYFFSWRNMHNKFTLMLGMLDSLRLISYRGGKIKILDDKLSIQMIL